MEKAGSRQSDAKRMLDGCWLPDGFGKILSGKKESRTKPRFQTIMVDVLPAGLFQKSAYCSVLQSFIVLETKSISCHPFDISAQSLPAHRQECDRGIMIYSKIDLLKKEIDTLRPFSGELLCSIKKYYKICLTWSSNALEGNTLTESETKVLIEDGLTVGGKQLKELLDVIFNKLQIDAIIFILHAGISFLSSNV